MTTFHGSYAGRSSVKILYNSVMARGDAIIANSHYTADLIRSLYPQAAERIRVIHRGTDFAAFSPRPSPRSGSTICAGPGGSRRMSGSCSWRPG